uniref:Scavenger receptor class F member 1-like n=1 Tax=Crassostrea virginica TaxID=6565 RepID=A0A8B8C342_CRAVI|nr:scavenger receptor class F member 1-like [Crassostrea virginica]
MCEVNITGCNIGHYGDECLSCPSHCTNNTCQMQVGHCFDCEDGYTGPMCEEVCPEGQYGKLCSFRCGSCLNQEPCHHINGSCLFGCSSGWKGDYCEEICDPGYFGFECKYTCNNTNCLNNTGCEPSSGHCTSGCFSSWFGPFCQDCAPTYYGDQCNISCSDHCQNKLCDQTTGYCFSCIPNRFGVFCENQAIIDNVAGKESIASSFDSNSNAGFVATSVIMVILLIGIIVYIVKQKWHSNTTQSSRENSTQSSRENYKIPTLPKQTDEYEEIRNKNTNGECDKASEYSEIA